MQVIWEDYPPDAATWEPPDNICDELIEAYEEALDDEAESDAELEDDPEDEEMEESAGTDGAAEDDADDADDADEVDDMEILEVSKILSHHVYTGAKAGSLYNVYVRVEYTDDSSSGRGYVPAEPLADSEAGRSVLARYLKCKAGAKISKYAPACMDASI